MGHQLLRWQHAIHQAPSHGLLGTDETTCQGQAPLGSSWILAGWWFQPTPLKNMSSSVGIVIPNRCKNEKCSKPPTSWWYFELFFWRGTGCSGPNMEKKVLALKPNSAPSLGKLEDLMDEFIPLSKWVITPVINGISRVNPLITGVITHLLSGMTLCFHWLKVTSYTWTDWLRAHSGSRLRFTTFSRSKWLGTKINHGRSVGGTYGITPAHSNG